MTHISPRALALSALLLPAALPAQAEEPRLDLSLGLGAAVTPDYDGSDDYEPVPVWNLKLGNLYHRETYVQLRGLSLESNLVPDDHLRLGVVGGYDGDYEDVEDDQVNDLSDPEDSLQVGIVAGYDFSARPHEDYVLQVEATYDALNGNGGLITPSASVSLPLDQRLFWGASLSATWASEDYMSNRFGISSADSTRSGLRQYDAGAGFKDVALGSSLTYAFSESWALTGFAKYQRLLGDAADSPIVDDRGNANNFMAGAVISYRF